YTDRNGNTQVVRYTVSADPDVADRGSAKTILSVAQPYGNHNGGHVAFGPDGMLYVGMGDGGSANDPHGHGQNRATLLGAMLRVDVDGGDPYAIPTDNPYVGRQDAAPEIWAIGLRARGGSPSIEMPACSTLPTSARTPGRRSTPGWHPLRP
ncbi:MAG: PQQ-dependent sugar dehydrogenase, partial [Gemmatimonadota bacterium]|nr:PQQ-dependent sugar dehydrogenase [Gemmatimonadota bacterium]